MVEGDDKQGADEQAKHELNAAELTERKEHYQRREEAGREAEQPNAALTHMECKQVIANRSLCCRNLFCDLPLGRRRIQPSSSSGCGLGICWDRRRYP